MYYLYIATGLAVLFSAVMDRKKTAVALKIAWKKFAAILPAFLMMLILVSIVLFFIPDTMISHYLGNESRFIGIICASSFGSITLMPGFVAYPLCGILLKKGVSYMVLAAFTTTLMMVGMLTYPVEKEYFGVKITIIRNVVSFFIALVIALVIGIFFGEL
ncbi:MAG: permease [Pseudomonadota bacterium]|nr:permease [Pseudomonadota bacterium]